LTNRRIITADIAIAKEKEKKAADLSAGYHPKEQIAALL
jgi:hypothetical protein